MSKNIGRLMFWFSDGEKLYDYTVRFSALAMLMNRLINENYLGKEIKFLNINFNTQSTYDHYENLKLNYTHSHGGHIQHNSFFLRDHFDQKSITEQKILLWDLALEALQKIADDTKNFELKTCSEFAYKAGIEKSLREDFILLQEFSKIGVNQLRAELWAEFEGNKVSSRFKVFNNEELIFDKVIDSASPDVEFFYAMYKKIIFHPKGQIIIKGHFEVEYLPLKIEINELLKKTQPNN
jgi:hypothetical protein